MISSLSEKELGDEITKRQDLKEQLISTSLMCYKKIDSYWEADYPDLVIKPEGISDEESGYGSESEDENSDTVEEYFHKAINRKLAVNEQFNIVQQQKLTYIINNINQAALQPIKRCLLFNKDYFTPLKEQIDEANRQMNDDDESLSPIQLQKFKEILLRDKMHEKFKESMRSRIDYERDTRILYGLIDKIKLYREALTQQQKLFETMLELQQEEPLSKLKSRYEPSESYLPLRCREIFSPKDSFQNSPDLVATAQGGAFYKQNEILDKNRVYYEQDLGYEKKTWSIAREKNTLEYQNEKTSWFSATVPLDVARAQILDVMNRFTDSVVTVSINNCNKKSEYNYRLVIEAYNLTHSDRQILCSSNNKVKIKNKKIVEQSELFKLHREGCSTTVNNIEELTMENTKSLINSR